MDQFEGDEKAVSSLHKYAYAKTDPINLQDPTGFYSQSDGYDAEREIFAIYQQDHPGEDSSSGGWARLDGGYRLKPDILNPTRKTFLEIKPFTLSGIYSGTIQLELYSVTFAPSGYFPEFGWVPSRNDIRINGRAALFVNAGGLVFYTDELRLSQEFLAITTVVAARELLRLGAFGEVGRILQVARLGSAASQLYLEADVGLVEATGGRY